MIDDVLAEVKQAGEKAREALKRELSKLRTGRAHAGMLDGLRVDYYGVSTPISQMASIGVPEARMISVKPWEKNQMAAIERAIRESDLGLNPQNDGDVIRIPVPALSEERRRDLVKLARKHGEDAKVAVRKGRHEALDLLAEFKKDGEVSEDEAERTKKKVEELVSEATTNIDQILQAKEKEILTV
ncbi:MAG: ribosome recycling factor [Polyangiaceae bacterium]|nr:ribosome recycling factor [Polyangiaceae bacterium]